MIIDAFIFFDELDLLELRLGQLDSVVDKFILIENNLTFTGEKKPLYYKENEHLFDKWNHKIFYANPNIGNVGPWASEIRHRESLPSIVKASGVSGEDILVFSDLDEIPNPKTIATYSPCLGLRNLHQHVFYYNFNHYLHYGRFGGIAPSRARIGTVNDLYSVGGDSFRGGKRDMDPTFPSLDEGGWHCSFFGSSIEHLRRKVNAYAHTDMAPGLRSTTDQRIAKDVANGLDLFHRTGTQPSTKISSDDLLLPSYFRENKDRFKLFTNEYFVETHKHLLGE